MVLILTPHTCKLFNLFKPQFQFSSVAQSCLTLCDPLGCSTPGFPVHHQLLELAQIHVHWVGDAIQPSHFLSSPPPPTFNLSQHQGLFQWVSSVHQVAKGLEFSFSINPSNEYSGLIILGLTGFDLIAVQGTLKSLLQHHSSKASIDSHIHTWCDGSWKKSYWKSCSFDWMDLCWQSYVSAF